MFISFGASSLILLHMPVCGYFTKQSNDMSWTEKEPLNAFQAIRYNTLSVSFSSNSDFGV